MLTNAIYLCDDDKDFNVKTLFENKIRTKDYSHNTLRQDTSIAEETFLSWLS